ncbi:MAG: hypothetical protein QXZ70_01115 [Candidatus Bathyarchaeia archaeon]
MGIRREIVTVLVGAFCTALFLQLGWLSPTNPFWDNALSGVAVMIVSRLVGRLVGGSK